MDFREQLPIEKGFASVFAGQIRPELQKLETYRLAKRKKGKTTLLLSLAIGAVISVIIYLAADGDVFGLVAIGVIMIISLITGLFL